MRLRITKPLTAEWGRANARAIENARAGRRAERVAERTYRVASAHGAAAYTVTVDSVVSLEASCTCPHGQGGSAGVCWHKSAAIAAAVQHIAAVADARSAAVATAPAAAVTPAPEHKIGVAYNIRVPQADSADANERKMARFGRQ